MSSHHDSSHESHSLAARLEQEGDVSVADCYQCGKCTAGCPLAYKMDEAPTAIMRYIQLGLREEAVKANTSWVCVSCQTCSTRCPQDVDIAGVMDGLRRISKRSGYGHVDRIVRTFLDVFLGTIKRYGRLYELGLIAAYNIASLQPFKDFSVAPGMILKGKIKFMPPEVKTRRAKEIFERCKKMEGQQ